MLSLLVQVESDLGTVAEKLFASHLIWIWDYYTTSICPVVFDAVFVFRRFWWFREPLPQSRFLIILSCVREPFMMSVCPSVFDAVFARKWWIWFWESPTHSQFSQHLTCVWESMKISVCPCIFDAYLPENENLIYRIAQKPLCLTSDLCLRLLYNICLSLWILMLSLQARD